MGKMEEVEEGRRNSREGEERREYRRAEIKARPPLNKFPQE
jgi:hypothetical protein